MQSLKVAHIIKDLDVGGIQTLLLDIFNYYKAEEQKHIIIVIGDGELRGEYKKFDNIFFIPKKIPFYDPSLIKKIRAVIKQEQVNLVHAHHVSEGVAAYFACKGLAVKTVQSFHSALPISNRQDRFVFKKLSHRADACVVPSKAQYLELEGAGFATENMHIVHNGVCPKRLQKKTQKDYREAFGIDSKKKLMSMVGNFYNDTRDQLTVCKALPAVFQRFPNARFVFWGGHSNKYIKNSERYNKCLDFCREANIADKVFFPGVESDCGGIIASLDLFVYASLHDTFGMAVVEALFCKKPLIVNDLDVLKEVLESEEHAFFYKTKDDKALSHAIIEALGNPEKAQAKAVKGHHFALKKYHIKTHIEKLNLLYQKIITQ